MFELKMLEGMLSGMIRGGASPLLILRAIHNICSHGELLEEVGLNVTQESLNKLFDGFDLSLEALDKMS